MKQYVQQVFRIQIQYKIIYEIDILFYINSQNTLIEMHILPFSQ